MAIVAAPLTPFSVNAAVSIGKTNNIQPVLLKLNNPPFVPAPLPSSLQTPAKTFGVPI